jgi:hypothetical protein
MYCFNCTTWSWVNRGHVLIAEAYRHKTFSPTVYHSTTLDTHFIPCMKLSRNNLYSVFITFCLQDICYKQTAILFPLTRYLITVIRRNRIHFSVLLVTNLWTVPKHHKHDLTLLKIINSISLFKSTCIQRPPPWSSGQNYWLQTRRPGFDSRHYQKKSSGSGTRSTQPREYNWGATW